MANTLTGRYFLDGVDLFQRYSLFIEGGTDGFLDYAPKKDGIVRVWQDNDGEDHDLTNIFLSGRDVTLNCAIVVDAATQADDFMAIYDAFLSHLRMPGKRRFKAARFGNRSFSVFYKGCSGWKMYTPIYDKAGVALPKVACKFNLTLREPEPDMGNSEVFLTTETGVFIVT